MDYPELHFEAPDRLTYRNLDLAYAAMRTGGGAPCILNAANEVVVQAFLEDRVGFLQMSDVVETCLETVPSPEKPTLEEYVALDGAARRKAASLL